MAITKIRWTATGVETFEGNKRTKWDIFEIRGGKNNFVVKGERKVGDKNVELQLKKDKDKPVEERLVEKDE